MVELKMTDSRKLLAEYVQTGSETAFGEFARRYVDLFYSTALRSVGGDTHRAEDVAQIVFVGLARTARTLLPEVMLGGWLHRHTCFVAAKATRLHIGECQKRVRAMLHNQMQTHQQPPKPTSPAQLQFQPMADPFTDLCLAPILFRA